MSHIQKNFWTGVFYPFRNPAKFLPFFAAIFIILLNQFAYSYANLHSEQLALEVLEPEVSAENGKEAIPAFDDEGQKVAYLAKNASHRYYFYITQLLLSLGLLGALGCGLYITWNNLKSYPRAWILGVVFFPLLASFVGQVLLNDFLAQQTTQIRQMVVLLQDHTQIDYPLRMRVKFILFFTAMTALALGFSSLAVTESESSENKNSKQTSEESSSMSELYRRISGKSTDYKILMISSAACLVTGVFVKVNINQAIIDLDLPNLAPFRQQILEIANIDTLSSAILYSLFFLSVALPGYLGLMQNAKISYLATHPDVSPGDFQDFIANSGLQLTWKNYINRIVAILSPMIAAAGPLAANWMDAIF